MAKDPAVLWYWNDWNGGTITLSRYAKGCYMDLLHAQFNNGHLSDAEVRTVLGQDYGQYWPLLSKKFSKDSDGNYYNCRLDGEIQRRAKFSLKQSANGKKGGRKPKHEPKINPTLNPKVSLLENETENEIEDLEKLKEYDRWTDEIIDGNDRYFTTMFAQEGIPAGDHIQHWILDHRDLLNRYPKMRPPSQQAFRKSLLKHIRENYKKQPNGTNKKQQHTDSAVEFVANYYGDKPGK